MELKKVKDIGQAAYLKINKLNLKGNLEWDGNSAYWLFEDNGSADKLIETYINNNAIGNLREFTDAQKTLKQMLYN